ncbi:maltose regulon regulatory protein [Escherichia coli]|uniref:Maltose regulon regulatory protein n=1 Tax=Escherichia coli TaxID=562 RepID=A0A2X3LWB5_ECOLX|nr:maltose regulon regulatory protein [Escherichia coli]
MQAAQLLTEHLIRNGHQRIAWLGGQSSSLTRAERVGGYCATLLKFGLPFHSDWGAGVHIQPEASRGSYHGAFTS